MLDVLLQDVQRIEQHYPVSCLGMSSVCEEKLALLHISEADPLDSPVQTERPVSRRVPAHELGILEAQRTLGLVPRNEYRRRRRELGHKLHRLRYSTAPVLAHAVDVAALLMDGIEDSLIAMGELSERFNSHRTVVF